MNREMNRETCAGTEPKRTARVDSLSNSVCQVRDLTSRIYSLADMLGVGVPAEPVTETEETTEPKRSTLVDLLDDFPEVINVSTKKAHQLLSQIENSLM